MKKSVFVLFALLALLPVAQAMAQTQTPAPAPAPVADAATTQFLATLAGGQAQAPSGLTPAPRFVLSNCINGPVCGAGQVCCFLCGTLPDGGDTSGRYGCFTGTRCPIVM